MKKIHILLIWGLCLLLFDVAIGQSRFHWGPELFPNYSGRRLILFSGTVSDDMIESLNATERGKLSLAGGLQAGWQGPKAGFRFGLLFSETGYRTIRQNIPPDAPDNPSGADQQRFLYRNYNLELPVSIDFIHELDDRNNFFFSLGTAMSYNLANQQTTFLYFGDRVERIDGPEPEGDFRKFNYAFITGMGWESELSGSLSLYLQPSFQFWFKGLLVEADIDRSLYALGLKAGLRFFTSAE